MPETRQQRNWPKYLAIGYVGAVIVCCIAAPSGNPNTNWLAAILLLTLPWSIGYGVLFAWAMMHDGVGSIALPALISAGLNILLMRWLLKPFLNEED